MKKTLLAISFTLISAASHAKSTGIPDYYPSIMSSSRALGMGNAFITMPGSDPYAQFYNPAAINDFDEGRDYNVTFPVIGFNPGFWEVVSDIWTLRNDLKSDLTAKQKIARFRSFTQSHTGEFHQINSGMSLFQIRNRRYSATFVADARAVVSFRNQTFPNFGFKMATSTGPVFGTAYALFDDSLQVGANAKMLFRMTKEETVTTADILTTSIKDLIGVGSWEKGFGGGVDLGAKYKVPVMEDSLTPTIAVTVQDVANSRFTGGVAEIPMSVSAGAGIFPEFGDIQMAILADFRELNIDTDFINKFHAGIELKFPEMIKSEVSIRAGCNQGYPAGGFTVDWGLVRWNAAIYGEEVAKYGHVKANYNLATNLELNF